MIDPRTIVFTPEEIAQVREAIRKARVDSARYARDSRPDPERMRTPLGPPGGNWDKWRKERQLLNDDGATRHEASSSEAKTSTQNAQDKLKNRPPLQP